MYYLVRHYGSKFNIKNANNELFGNWCTSTYKVFRCLKSFPLTKSPSSLAENTILYEFSEFPTYEYIQSNYPELLI
jgi:hypothetical protein